MRNICAILPNDTTPYEESIRWLEKTKKKTKVEVSVQVMPASFDTKMFVVPKLATPTKILEVAFPVVPDVESKVTKEIPSLSELYPVVSAGSGIYVPCVNNLIKVS